MEEKRNHFELTFMPKHAAAMGRLEKALEEKGLKKSSEGKGTKNSRLEGFRYRKYRGSGFSVCLLFSKTRDGIMFESDEPTGDGIEFYHELLDAVASHNGVVQWPAVVRTGPLKKGQSDFGLPGKKIKGTEIGSWAPGVF